MKAFLVLPAPHNPQIPIGMGTSPQSALGEAMSWAGDGVLRGVQILPCTDVLYRHFVSLGEFHSVYTHRHEGTAYAYLNNPDETI